MATKTDNQKNEGQEGEVNELECKFKKKVSLEDKEEVPSDPINNNKDASPNNDNKHTRIRKTQKEDNKDPTDIPKNGKYYMHDDRIETIKEPSKKKGLKNEKEWKHDKFEGEKHISRCKNDINKTDIVDTCEREESVEKSVKGRGKTRYGKKESLEMDEVVAMQIERKQSKNHERKVRRKKKTELKNEKEDTKTEVEDQTNKKDKIKTNIVEDSTKKNGNKIKLLKNFKQMKGRDGVTRQKNNYKTNGKLQAYQERGDNNLPKKEITMNKKKTKNEENLNYVKKYEVGGHVITQPIKSFQKISSDQPVRRNYTNNRNVNISKSLRGASTIRRGNRGTKGGLHSRKQITSTSGVQQQNVAVYVPPEAIPYPHVIQYANVIPATPILPPTGAVYFNLPSAQQLPKPEKRERKILPIAEPSNEANGENKS
ncbi:Btz domain-containing protein [Strongyloides ratti]|uniref:Btz domain-containing protein n=1 Tax=Strongyloides ratti TaxID=34506 RepID=A0A090MXL9_STRRB|nr:Btz domain-containing protein [Strongyloides ratti]CEF65664.1 Btz domain-containing protein [Strongyloides ratti]